MPHYDTLQTALGLCLIIDRDVGLEAGHGWTLTHFHSDIEVSGF